MVDVREQFGRFQQAGGGVAVVARAEPEEAAKFARELRLPFPVLADPQGASYRAFGAPRGGLLQIAGPRVWVAGFKALLRGGAGKPGRDVMQLQSTFVIDRQGAIRFAHRPANSADQPSCDELIAVLAGLE